ncbi:hypothetical protein KEM52_005267 [Ascosphaera acerosa]|nr:hypothetical protein KEM52_005267 [Ascosphaera acerosa]
MAHVPDTTQRFRPRAYHHEPPPPPSPSLRSLKSCHDDSAVALDSDDLCPLMPGMSRPRQSSFRSIASTGSAQSAERILELRKSLTLNESEIPDFNADELAELKKDHLRALITLASSHPLFNYLRQQRRIDDLAYTLDDRKCIYDETPVITGCAGPALGVSKGKGLWSVRRLVNLDQKGLVGGVLDAFAGLLSFYDGSEGMEDQHYPIDPDSDEDLSDNDEPSDPRPKKKLRRFAVACQIRSEERKVRLYMTTEDEAPIGDDIRVYLKRVWALLRDLSHSDLKERFFVQQDKDKEESNYSASRDCSSHDADRVLPEVPSDEPSPFNCPALIALLSFTMLNSFAHWHPRFLKHYSHVRSARRIAPQLFRIFQKMPDGHGAQVRLVWASFLSEAEALNDAFVKHGREYLRSHDFRERMFETIACLENMAQGQGTVADILIKEAERRRKEEVESLKRREKLTGTNDGAGTAPKHITVVEPSKPSDKGKGKERSADEDFDYHWDIASIRQEPSCICRCPITQCMRKLVSPFDHLTTLIDFATLSHRRSLLEFDLEVVPLRISTDPEPGEEDPALIEDCAPESARDPASIRRRTRALKRASARTRDRIPPSRSSLQTLMLSSFFSNVMSRYEPRSTRRKIAGLAAELQPPAILPERHIHPEIKLLCHLTSTRIPTARHIGVSSPPCIPCTVLFDVFNGLSGRNFHLSGVSIVTNGPNSAEGLLLDDRSLFGGKKTEIGNGKYNASWTLPRIWRDTEISQKVAEELKVRIGEALLREVDYRRIMHGDDGWWEAGVDGQPAEPKNHAAILHPTDQPRVEGSAAGQAGPRARPPQTTTTTQEEGEPLGKARASTKKWRRRMRNPNWSFMDPTSACESQ